MKPKLVGISVRAKCPNCDGAVTSFENREHSGEFGKIDKRLDIIVDGVTYDHCSYVLLRCAGCRSGAIAEVWFGSTGIKPVLKSFFPISIENKELPPETSETIVKEFREAEACYAYGFNRAASALIRSVLEKTLKANGYIKRDSLEAKIDRANEDGIIHNTRRKRAHDDIRVLGNDVLHEEYREVIDDDVENALHYAQRILEDFYDDRPTVLKALKEKGRLSTGESEVNEK